MLLLFMFSRYVDSSKAVIEKADRSRLQPIALSCVLNIGACKLKMSNWQGAIDSCLEVSLCEIFFFSSSYKNTIVFNVF
jgi:hypothetical protein